MGVPTCADCSAPIHGLIAGEQAGHISCSALYRSFQLRRFLHITTTLAARPLAPAIEAPAPHRPVPTLHTACSQSLVDPLSPSAAAQSTSKRRCQLPGPGALGRTTPTHISLPPPTSRFRYAEPRFDRLSASRSFRRSKCRSQAVNPLIGRHLYPYADLAAKRLDFVQRLAQVDRTQTFTGAPVAIAAD